MSTNKKQRPTNQVRLGDTTTVAGTTEPTTPVLATELGDVQTPETDVVDTETEVIDGADELATTPVAPEPALAPVKSFLDATAEQYGIDVIPSLVSLIDSRMQDYVSSMTGIRPIDTETGATYQTNLYYTIIMALEQEEANHAMLAMSVILNYMHVYSNDSFSERLVYRFFNALNLDSKKRAGFEKLLFAFLNLANPANRRKFVMRMDVNRIVDVMPSELCKRNLLTFVAA